LSFKLRISNKQQVFGIVVQGVFQKCFSIENILK